MSNLLAFCTACIHMCRVACLCKATWRGSAAPRRQQLDWSWPSEWLPPCCVVQAPVAFARLSRRCGCGVWDAMGRVESERMQQGRRLSRSLPVQHNLPLPAHPHCSEAAKATLREASKLAPLHNPPNLYCIEAAQQLFPEAPHVSCSV